MTVGMSKTADHESNKAYDSKKEEETKEKTSTGKQSQFYQSFLRPAEDPIQMFSLCAQWPMCVQRQRKFL
jgi:hypothetical protein